MRGGSSRQIGSRFTDLDETCECDTFTDPDIRLMKISTEGGVSSQYQAYEFRVRIGCQAGTLINLRVHAPTREQAWARVCQMHPHAVEASPVNGKEQRRGASVVRELSHSP